MPKHKILRQVGLKTTNPRVKILQTLQQHAEKHLSAEDIYHLIHDSKENISLATIYRVLAQFEQAELVIRHNFTNHSAVFELNEKDRHHHIICKKCGCIQEFYDPVIENQQVQIAKNYGFKILDHRLDIYGICQICQNGYATLTLLFSLFSITA